jgi:membrane-bound serine protease (ClpP class)
VTALIVALVLLGASLLVAEAHVVSYGVLGVAGVAMLATAGVLAIEAAGAGAIVALAVVLPLAAVVLGLMLVAGRKALTVSRRRPVDALIGSVGVVRSAIAPEGQVAVAGELWRARRSWADDVPELGAGEHVVVESVHGLTLSVRRAEEWELMP